MQPISTRDPRWVDIREATLETSVGPLRTLTVEHPASGTPHLLVHGLGVTSATWVDVMSMLADTGPVVAIDLPGFGGSPLPEDQTADVSFLTGAIEAARQSLGWDQMVLHGNSLGGLLAVRHAAARPDTVQRLMLAAPALPPGPGGLFKVTPAALIGIAPLVVPGLGELAMRAASRSRRPFPGAERVGEAVFADVSSLRSALSDLFADESAGLAEHAWRRRALLQASRSLTQELATWWRTDPLVAGLRMPVTVVAGRQDRLLPGGVIDRIAERRPDWALHIVERAGHSPFVERPDAYMSALTGEDIPAVA